MMRLTGAALGALFLGPAGAYGGWKAGGFLASGNPVHLLPGGEVADALSIAADVFDLADLASHDLGGLDQTDGGRKR